MHPALPTQHGIDPAASTTPTPRVDVTPQLSDRTVAWLAHHPHSRRLVRSVWDTLAELERAGQHSGPIDALRRVLGQATFIDFDVTWQDVVWTAASRVRAPSSRSELCFAARGEVVVACWRKSAVPRRGDSTRLYRGRGGPLLR
jgi:hypothetical protein